MTVPPPTDRQTRISARHATIAPVASIASWATLIGPPGPEAKRSQLLARFGGLTSIATLAVYLVWRIGFTMPAGGWNLFAATLLVTFEAVPIIGIVVRLVTLWNIDCRGPEPVTEVKPGQRCVVFIPTYNEPVEVIAPTIAAACDLQPVHQTWVLDDGDRAWVRELTEAMGARYVCRPVHDHAKAGNMNHAIELLAAEEAAGAEPIDIIAVLDCDHVPLPAFLTATLGWFEDPNLALVQAPQSYYNAGAYDDDGETGEQGVFFHVLLPGRNADGAGPFWCGSTSLIRASALREVGGISTATIVEDMHTTLGLIRAGWKTAYHHQTLALGLAPDTPDQYLLQRRRWGMGSMQVLVTEKLWAAKQWLSWRNFYEYLGGTVWWMEGVGTVLAFLIPALVLISGARTSTANPLVFVLVFVVMFSIRLWGAKRLFRGHLQWRTAFALRILRIPIGLSCLWWLVTRRTLSFQVTPKSGADERLRGRAPRILWGLVAFNAAVLLYAFLGLSGMAPWHVSPPSVGASGVWLTLSGVVLVLGIRRIQKAEFATSRRNAYRFPVRASVSINGQDGELLDVSTGGAAVSCSDSVAAALLGVGTLELLLPGAEPVLMQIVRRRTDQPGREIISLRVTDGDWTSYRALSRWLFHTPAGAVSGLPDQVPAVAAIDPDDTSAPRVLALQRGL